MSEDKFLIFGEFVINKNNIACCKRVGEKSLTIFMKDNVDDSIKEFTMEYDSTYKAKNALNKMCAELVAFDTSQYSDREFLVDLIFDMRYTIYGIDSKFDSIKKELKLLRKQLRIKEEVK